MWELAISASRKRPQSPIFGKANTIYHKSLRVYSLPSTATSYVDDLGTWQSLFQLPPVAPVTCSGLKRLKSCESCAAAVAAASSALQQEVQPSWSYKGKQQLNATFGFGTYALQPSFLSYPHTYPGNRRKCCSMVRLGPARISD